MFLGEIKSYQLLELVIPFLFHTTTISSDSPISTDHFERLQQRVGTTLVCVCIHIYISLDSPISTDHFEHPHQRMGTTLVSIYIYIHTHTHTHTHTLG
jgi:hypothetical protein